MTRARDVANLIGSGNYSSTTFTATAGQTAFTISHTQGFVQVFMNGLLLDLTVDYTSNGSAVTLTSGAAAGDEIEVVAYNTFSVGDALNQAAADTRYVNTAGGTMTGNLGIHEASPSGSLHVKGTSSTHGKIILEAGGSGGSANNNFMEFNKHDGTKLGELEVGESVTNGGSLVFKTTPSGGSATTRMTVNHDGIVTKPNQVSFKAHGGNSAYITTSPLQFPNIGGRGGHNIGNHYNTSNSTFTAPVGGRYLFHVHIGIVRITSTGGYIYPNLEVNSGSIMYTYNNQSFNNSGSWNQYANSHMTQIVNLSANDVVRVTVTFGSADYYNGPGELSFAGHLLG